MMETDADPPRPAGDGTASNAAVPNLCRECMNVDFENIFDEQPREPAIPGRAYRKWFFCLDGNAPECSFCCIAYNDAMVAANQRGLSPSREDMYAHCVLLRSKINPETDRSIYNGFKLAWFGVGEVLVYLGREAPNRSEQRADAVFILERVDYCPLEVCTRINSSRTSISVRRKAPSTKFCLSTLRAWLAEYDSLEGMANTADPPKFSLQELREHRRFRLIDVDTGTIIVPDEGVRYVALSYVCGKPNRIWESTCQNALITENSLLGYANVPQTILDAMTTVKSIGERYLWVNVACISQSDAEDKAFVIARMGSIYRNAYLIIIAADGSDANAGIGRIVGASSVQESPVYLQPKDGPLTIAKGRSSLPDVLDATPWQTRGWTFQEAEMSQVKVIVTSEEIFFHSWRFRAREACEPVRISGSHATCTYECSRHETLHGC